MNVSILNYNYSLFSNLGKCICKINRGYSIIYFIYYENCTFVNILLLVSYIYRKLYEISKPIYWFTINSLNYYFAHNWMNKKIFYLLLLPRVDLCQIYFRIKLECKCDIKLPTLLSYIHIKIWHFRIQNTERDKRKKNWNKNARQISL